MPEQTNLTESELLVFHTGAHQQVIHALALLNNGHEVSKDWLIAILNDAEVTMKETIYK